MKLRMWVRISTMFNVAGKRVRLCISSEVCVFDSFRKCGSPTLQQQQRIEDTCVDELTGHVQRLR